METGIYLLICPDADRECGKLNLCVSSTTLDKDENLCSAMWTLASHFACSPWLSPLFFPAIAQPAGPSRKVVLVACMQ